MRRKKRQDMADKNVRVADKDVREEDVAKLMRSVGRRDLSEERWAVLEERIADEVALWTGRSAVQIWGERVWMSVVEAWRWAVAMVWERGRILVPAVGIAALCVVGTWVTKKGNLEDRGMLRTNSVRRTNNVRRIGDVRWTTYSLYSSSARKEAVSLYSVGKEEYVR